MLELKKGLLTFRAEGNESKSSRDYSKKHIGLVTHHVEKIKEVLIDLRYRGDYSTVTRSHLQKLAYNGGLMGFRRIIADRST